MNAKYGTTTQEYLTPLPNTNNNQNLSRETAYLLGDKNSRYQHN